MLAADQAAPESSQTLASTWSSEELKSWIVGRVFGGHYRVQQHLGSGGFGDVFLAVQQSTGQTVALKVLRPRHGSNEPSIERQVARFLREMRVCAGLYHAHVVRIIDSGQTDNGLLFSVFEYVPGRTLAKLLEEQGALAVQTTIDLMMQVLDALVCAHGQGVIHRDLKPSNIMVSVTGARPQATVLDFGVSAFLDGIPRADAMTLTLTAELLGTPAYAAPEQLWGQPPLAKSDLYAWGLVFLECLLGKRVFDAASFAEIAYRQLSREPVPMPAVLEKHWLGTLLRWVLDKQLDRRAGNAQLVLDRFAEGRAIDDITDLQGFLLTQTHWAERSQRISVPPDPTGPSSSSAVRQERRQITVLSCAYRARPAAARGEVEVERLDQLLRDSQNVCLDIASRFGGHGAGSLGGQLVLCFGYLSAADSDARIAGVVALEIMREFRRSPASDELALRIGIHTGMIVTEGARLGPSSLVGTTPAEALHLAALAPESAILLSAETRSQLGAAFELHPLTPGDDASAWRLLAESNVESAPPIDHSSAPFSGREQELAQLALARELAHRGQGSALLVHADPGMGKSRLLRELRHHGASDASAWLEARCLPESQPSALSPISDLVRRELDQWEAPVEQRVARLTVRLSQLEMDLERSMPLLCPWLGIALPAAYPVFPYAPLKRKEALLGTLVELLLRIAARRNALLIIEDLHWADPTTLECVDQLVARIRETPTLLLLTTRNELASRWPAERVRTIGLGSLGHDAVERMLDGLTTIGRPLTPALAAEVIERADGVPMFVEEIVRLLGSDGSEAISSSGVSQERVRMRAVPRTLRDLLMGRLDRLGPAKETAQVAAAIGREFEHTLLARALGDGEARLLADIEAMVSADLLLRRRRPGDPLYIFRHALIRDAAYETLTQDGRKQVHRAIAEALEQTSPELALERPEKLADHWAVAGELERAIDYGTRATGTALGASLFGEAALQAQKLLDWSSKVESEPRRHELQLRAIGLLAPALMATRGWGSADVGELVERAAHLSEQVPASASIQYSMLWLLLMYQTIRANFASFDEVEARAHAVARETGDRVFESVIYGIAGQKLLVQGRLSEARAACELALAGYDREAHAGHRQQFGQDVEVFTLGTLGMLYALQGHLDESLEVAERALARAEELKSPYNVCMAKAYLAGTLHYLGDRRRTGEVTAVLYADAERQGIVDWLPIASILGAWARGSIDDADRETERLSQMGNRYAGPYWSFTIAQSEYAAGRYDAALARCEIALASSRELGSQYYVPELERLSGECLAKLAAAEDEHASPHSAWQRARAAFERAIATAQQQGAKLPELRATLGLALLPQAGSCNCDEMRRLAQIVSWFNVTSTDLVAELGYARKLLAHESNHRGQHECSTGS